MTYIIYRIDWYQVTSSQKCRNVVWGQGMLRNTAFNIFGNLGAEIS